MSDFFLIPARFELAGESGITGNSVDNAFREQLFESLEPPGDFP